jgi:hypothetical protein
MGAVTIQQMANRVSDLMTDRLGIKGHGLSDQLKHGGSRLPRRVQTAALALAQAAENAPNPKLLLQIDQEAVAANYDICLRHLRPMNRAHRLRGRLLGFSTSVLFGLLIMGALIAALMVWRGLI